ncbi:BolA family transcriptional regulator [Ehrlichia ruminantium]|uniref:BolA family transcriptional regulator n=1 Tax=Ehrlichia ruminantium TaxID=779 RepID=A0AAE6QB88_EHRRU|nr:BolA family protein [Ehrlichia ruminantium]QGR03892.1 BolA family transcriptional regulator [Ehrlichia ruminantium]QGR04817.1 BolA family transcriptional regulator [Ehrlichia ruminantium]
MDIIQKIKNKVTSTLNVLSLEIIDESIKHTGHNFHSISNISHIKIILVSDDFTGMIKINRQRLLHKILYSEIKLIHSISFHLYTHKEYNSYT